MPMHARYTLHSHQVHHLAIQTLAHLPLIARILTYRWRTCFKWRSLPSPLGSPSTKCATTSTGPSEAKVLSELWPPVEYPQPA
jgi:hypothetical protein